MMSLVQTLPKQLPSMSSSSVPLRGASVTCRTTGKTSSPSSPSRTSLARRSPSSAAVTRIAIPTASAKLSLSSTKVSLVQAAPSSVLTSPKATATMLPKQSRMASSSVSASTKLTSLTSPTNVSKSGSLCCSRSSKILRQHDTYKGCPSAVSHVEYSRRATFCTFIV